MNCVLKPVWMALKIGSPSPPTPMKAATVARLMIVTVAIRMPAMIAGIASGSSTRQSVWRRVSPIAWAASSASGGTSRRPVRMLRKRMSSV